MDDNVSNSLLEEVDSLQSRVDSAQLPQELKIKTDEMIVRLRRTAKFGSYTEEYERVSHYIDWIIKVPWNNRSQDRLDLHEARQIFDKHHYGLEPVKERILEYLAVLKLNQDSQQTDFVARAPILCLVGLVGTGKTTFAYSLAEATGRQISRIPFGGMGSARDLRGQSRLHLEAEPGYIIKSLVRSGTRNPVILLDEIDRVTAEARADIMGVLVELLDPEQNQAFIDHYIDYPVNLSDVLFIATANNTDNIATAVMDRLEPLSMPSYSDQEKITIARNYLLPKAIRVASLPENSLVIDDELWPQVVRPLGYDAGIRTLNRTIEGLIRKTARLIVEGKTDQVHVTEDNVKEFLPQY